MHKQFRGKERTLRPSEKVFSVIMQRLTKWVFNRYDCTIDHVFFAEGDSDHETLKSLFRKNAFVRIDGALNFPIHFAGDIVGVVRATENRSELKVEQQKELHQLFSLMIEPTLKDIEQLEYVESLEEHMSLVHQPTSQNLVRFQPRKREEDLFLPDLEPPRATRLMLPCLIEAKNSYDGRRLAQEIHSQSGRYAFFPIEDLDKESLEKPDELLRVGSATIFVPALEALSKQETLFLSRYLSDFATSKESPQVIAITNNLKTLKEQADDEMIQLISRLSVAVVKMDRSFSEYKKVGLMNLLFSALESQQPSH